MPTKSAFSIVGLAHKVCLAAEEQGYTPELLNTLAEHPTLLGELRKVQLGFSEIKPILQAINCDADPFIPEGWSVLPDKDQLPNRAKGIFTWDQTKVKLYLSKKQKGDKYLVGNDLRKELASQLVLNANVLDYLLKPENQHLIPKEWKGKYVFFWGTIYRGSGGGLCVRCLYFFGGGGWDWRYLWLGSGFGPDSPAAVCAS